MALKEDYKDAVFAGLRKYKMLDNGDGTVSPVDMTEYEAAGDKFGAKDVNAITKMVNCTGDAFDPGRDYEVGDYTIYDNTVWKFTTAHPAGEWDESHVEKTRILVEIAEQNKNSSYSTEETVCGTWIDGKPIYRKVFFKESLSFNSSSNDYSEGIADALPTGAKLLKLYGSGEDHADSLNIPLNLYNSAPYVLYNICTYIMAGTIVFRSTRLLSNIYVILEYVKS